MTDQTKPDLQALSDAATPGVWVSDPDAEMDGPFFHIDTVDRLAVARGVAFTDAFFLVALVNAFRSGELIPADLAAPVKVKALEWEDFGERGAKAQAWRKANYMIARYTRGYLLEASYPGYGEGDIEGCYFETIALAKAAAQAHHDALVRSMLEPAPVSQTRAEVYAAVCEGLEAALDPSSSMDDALVSDLGDDIADRVIRALSPAPDSKEQALTDLAREGQKWDADSKEGGE